MTPTPESPSSLSSPSRDRTPFRWVPIRQLAVRHKPRILRHLLALGERDRYLRFGYAASDEQIAVYVERIDFDRDEVFGIFDRKLDLAGMAHLADLGTRPDGSAQAEFGVSVSESARGRGWGARLFDRAVLHARNRGVDTLVIHALTENSVMLRIARNAGAKLVYEGSDATARLQLPPESFRSHLEAIFEDQAAEIDYRMRVGAKQFDDWLAIFSPAAPAAPADSLPPETGDTVASITRARDSAAPPAV